MRKVILSVAAIAAVSTQSFAAESLSEAFKEGKVSGQLRAFYINRDYTFADSTATVTTNKSNDRDGLALGGKMGFETAAVHGISAGAMFYSTNKIDHEALVTKHNDKTLFNKDDQGYTFLGQAYLNLKAGNTNVKVGRQELNTPLAGGDDARMIPNVFEAAILTNTDIKDTTLVAGHVSQISYGTFANAYVGTANAELALASGYGAQTTTYKNGQFQSMGKGALGDSAKNSGVSVVAAIYKGLPNTTLQVWDYYAHDILNAIYAQADVSWKCLFNPDVKMTGSVQYIRESDMGGKDLVVGGQYYAAQLSAKAGNLTLTGAYSQTPKSNVTHSATNFKGDIISPWGGMPAFTQGMVTRHQFFNDTTAYKVSAAYNMKDMIGSDVTATVYYASFDVGSDNLYTQKVETTERGFDIIQNNAGIKNLQLRFRGNFPEDFRKAPTSSTTPNETTSWAEYRLIANYNF